MSAQEPIAGALRDVYDRLAPELGVESMVLGGHHSQHVRIAAELRASGHFADPRHP